MYYNVILATTVQKSSLRKSCIHSMYEEHTFATGVMEDVAVPKILVLLFGVDTCHPVSGRIVQFLLRLTLISASMTMVAFVLPALSVEVNVHRNDNMM